MPRKTQGRLPTTTTTFKTNPTLKAEFQRALRRHPGMNDDMTAFLNDCMRQFVIQMRSKETVPAYPLEFVTKEIEK